MTYETQSERPEYPKYVSVTYLPERNDAGDVTGFAVLASDATERYENERALSHLAYHDGLTGLPNRRMLNDSLEAAMARSQRNLAGVALLYLDIDHFKSINDSRGDKIGDLLLVEFAKRLRASVRENDSVCRLGGDEFTLILEDLPTVCEAELVTLKILAVARIPFTLDGCTLDVTTSIGLADIKDRRMSLEDFLHASDTALYEAKKLGRNRVVSVQLVGMPS